MYHKDEIAQDYISGRYKCAVGDFSDDEQRMIKGISAAFFYSIMIGIDDALFRKEARVKLARAN